MRALHLFFFLDRKKCVLVNNDNVFVFVLCTQHSITSNKNSAVSFYVTPSCKLSIDNLLCLQFQWFSSQSCNWFVNIINQFRKKHVGIDDLHVFSQCLDDTLVSSRVHHCSVLQLCCCCCCLCMCSVCLSPVYLLYFTSSKQLD